MLYFFPLISVVDIYRGASWNLCPLRGRCLDLYPGPEGKSGGVSVQRTGKNKTTPLRYFRNYPHILKAQYVSFSHYYDLFAIFISHVSYKVYHKSQHILGI